jgi:hypothetical protein
MAKREDWRRKKRSWTLLIRYPDVFKGKLRPRKTAVKTGILPIAIRKDASQITRHVGL